MAEFVIHRDGLRIEVDKVGGGTVGNKYVGHWDVSIVRNDGSVVFNGTYTVGMPHTHAWIAKAVFYMAGDEE